MLGFVLIGAWLMGDALRWLRLPRLTGYLIFGAAIGPYAGNLITGVMAGQLQVVTGIATTLIALIAGLTLSVERLGPRLAPDRAPDGGGGGGALAAGVRGLVAGVALAAGGRRGDAAARAWPWRSCSP